jgi:sulfur dioxygenase
MKRRESSLTCEQVYNILATDPDLIQVLDLRSEADFKRGHIPGAEQLVLEDLEQRLRTLGARLGILVAPRALEEQLHRDFDSIGQWTFLSECERWQQLNHPVAGESWSGIMTHATTSSTHQESFMSSEVIFQQLFEPESSTYTYIIADAKTREAAIIDPVIETVERDLKVIEELELRLLYVLDTHIHADHLTAAGEIRERTGAKVAVSQVAGVKTADILLEDGQTLLLGPHKIQVMATPGHTNTCMSFYFSGRVFTGDALLIRGTGRTDFQQGSADKLFESVTEKLFNLPDETVLYPGHDYRGLTSSTIGTEKRWNPRLGGGKSKEQFKKIMSELKLAYPKKIDVAVPANMVSGLVESTRIMHPQVVDRIPEVTVEDLHRHLGQVRIIDVRQPDEFIGELKHIPGAELVTLGPELKEFLAKSDRNEEIIFVCRSGGRSGQATAESLQLGYTKTANMIGGMIKWNEMKYPTEG